MNSQDLQTESNPPLHTIFSQESHSSIIHNDKSCSNEDDLSQLKEPLLDQPTSILSEANAEEEESKAILKKVKDIDDKFKEGWIYAYDFWLSVVITAATGEGVLLATSIKDWVFAKEYEKIRFLAIPLGLAFFYLFWLARLALLHKEALKKKDAKMAAQAYSSLVRAMITSFILSVIFFLTVIYERSYYSGYEEGQRYRGYESSWMRGLCAFLWQFMKLYVIPAGVSVYGSYKVKTVLEERTNLLLKVPNKIGAYLDDNHDSSSDEERTHQPKKPQLGQPTLIPSELDQKMKESKTALKKVKDIDRSLEEGWLFAYEFWLYIIIILALSKGVFMCGWMAETWTMTRKEDLTGMIAFSILLIVALYYIYWSVRQALLHREALKKKDSKIAAQAYSSVVRLSIHYFGLCVIFLVVGRYIGYYYFKFTDDWENFLFDLGYPTFQFVSHYAIPVPVSIYGSYKLKNVLKERERLIEEIDLPKSSPLMDPLGKRPEEPYKELDQGLFLAYKIWLYLTPVLGIYVYTKLYRFGEVDYYYYRKEEDHLSFFSWGSWIYKLHCLFWFLREAWNEIIAIKQRDFKLAIQTHNSLVWLARYYSIWILFEFLDSVSVPWPMMTIRDIMREISFLIHLSVVFIQFYVIPVGISIYGSKQVKIFLEEKEKLIPKTHSADNDHADSSESKT